MPVRPNVPRHYASWLSPTIVSTRELAPKMPTASSWTDLRDMDLTTSCQADHPAPDQNLNASPAQDEPPICIGTLTKAIKSVGVFCGQESWPWTSAYDHCSSRQPCTVFAGGGLPSGSPDYQIYSHAASDGSDNPMDAVSGRRAGTMQDSSVGEGAVGSPGSERILFNGYSSYDGGFRGREDRPPAQANNAAPANGTYRVWTFLVMPCLDTGQRPTVVVAADAEER
ncbi:hypothetical protein PCL_07047 [Purpureocillium lilacinum]|uniref:Uncharacterized protein n=1 Tax=Purpureocillium lilacinum TaxID=33203 RepID=A0A2U3DT68_PURLI|nr:hypothetical protein PCL_07047 [Purpureocillium lilacinum]